MGIFFSAQQVVWTEYYSRDDGAQFIGVISDPALGLAIRKSRVFWKWTIEMFHPRGFTYEQYRAHYVYPYVPPTNELELHAENGKVRMDLADAIFDFRINRENKFMFYFGTFDLTQAQFRLLTAQYKDMIQTLVKRFVDTYVDAHGSFAAAREAGDSLALRIVAENQLPSVIRDVADRPLDPMTAGPPRFTRIENFGLDHVPQLAREMRKRFEE